MTDEDRYGGYTPRRAARFYVPLLLQAFSQSLTYPLVASIVTHGERGVEALAAFAQGQCVMFLIGAIGGGLVMTGMVFGRTFGGFLCFRRLNALMMVSLLAVQVILVLPPFDRWVFGELLNLPPDLRLVARDTLVWGVIMQASFFLRNVPLVALFNARASMEANIATIARIVLTAACPLVFIPLGWTGPGWGLFAITAGCVLELVLTWYFARPYVAALPLHDGVDIPHRVWNQFAFTLPLSIGSFLLALSPFLVAAFVGRSANALAMLAIHYVTIGLANPVAYGALRMQAVAIQFPPEYERDRRMIFFSIGAGLCLGIVPLACALPGVGDWYFGTVQNLPAADVPTARFLMAIYAVWPALQALRGRAEGLAAWLKRPRAVMWGQLAHVLALASSLAVTLYFGVTGWKMGVTAILIATTLTIFTVQIALSRR